MSDAPVVFKRTKSKHAARRISTPDHNGTEDGGDEGTEGTESPSTLATKLKSKLKTRAKPKARLSFGGDEEEGDGEEFQLKKGKLSTKIALNKASGKASPGISSGYEPVVTPRSTGPTYDAAYLSELKASTPNVRPPLPTDDSVSYDADVSMDVDVEPQASVIDLSGDQVMETAIPSEPSIMAAKQKRERLRSNKATPEDYISLSVSKRDDFSKGPHPDSRLMREEDELGDAEEEWADYTSAQERIALGKKSRKKAAQKRREDMNEMIVDAEEEDEETKEWEQEQLRRGGHRAESMEAAPKPTYKPAPIPAVTPIPTLDAAVARLTKQMSDLTTSHAHNSASMVKIAEERAQIDEKEKEMRMLIEKAEEKRSWFSAFRDWIESVAIFLDEKFPQLEKLEDVHISLIKERADMISRRRTAEDQDDLALFLGPLPQPPPQPDQLDELGRVIPQANPAATRADRTAAREARRIRRRAAGRAQQPEEEGYSTDSSLPPSDADDYQVAMRKLGADGREIMADVKAEEFQNPEAGLGKWFAGWRARFGDIYTGAWGGLGMVGAWEFWVRLEMLGWCPFEEPRSLDSFGWYDSLYRYSRQPNPDDDEPELGPDGDLVSAMLTTAVIPRLCVVIEGGGLDAYSARDMKHLIDLAEQLELSVEQDNPKFELFLKSVHTVFRNAITSTEATVGPFLERNQPRFDPAGFPARQRFLNRRSKLLRNVLRWRKHTGDRLGVGQLALRLVDSSMMPVAMTGWEVGGHDCMRKVVQALPNDLITPSLRQQVGP